MKINLARAFSGPNILAPRALALFSIEVAGPQFWPHGETGRAAAAALLRLLPGLAGHPGRTNAPSDFPDDLRAAAEDPEAALPLGYVAARVATELQRRYDDGIKPAGLRLSADPKIFHFYFLYDDPEIALAAGRAGVDIVLSLLPPESRPASQLPEGTTPAQLLEAFLARRKTLVLDQTTIALTREATRRDIPWFVIDRAKRMVQLGQGRHLRRVCESITSATSHLATVLQNDKSATNRILRESLLPVPRHHLVATPEAAVAAAQKIGYPVVVKPVDSKKGRGITLHVADAATVRRAFAAAIEHSRYALIESYITGRDHRILIVDGRMVAASIRLPGAVTGDGRSSIAELVAKVNQNPRRGVGFTRRLSLIVLDDQADYMLARRGYDRDSVPPQGEEVALRGTANISTGGTAVDVTDQVHPDTRRMLERAARVMGLDVAGIDFLTPDITRSYREVGGGICEVNASPGLRPHLSVDSEPKDVVGRIIDSLFPRGGNGRIPIAAITGTNGKTTTSDILAHILQIGGSEIGVGCVGLATTNGTYINGDLVARGDHAGHPGARVLLRDPSVEAAVLETARGGLAQSGLAVDWCDVAAVLNVAHDHIGYSGIGSLDEMARLKGRVAEAARKLVVLNADDPRCLAMAALKAPPQVCLFTLEPIGEGLKEHLAQGGLVLNLEDRGDGETIVLHRAEASETIIAVKNIPGTLGGAARHNAQNAMAATGLALGLGLSRAKIAAALAVFHSDPESNLGRLNVFDEHPFKVVLDAAHNTEGLTVICDTLRAIPASGRRIAVLGNVASRHGEHIEEAAALVADLFDVFICSRNKAQSEMAERVRGFPSTDIPIRLAAALGEHGVDPARIEVIDYHRDAVERGLQLAEAGDLLVVLTGEPHWCRDRIRSFEG